MSRILIAGATSAIAVHTAHHFAREGAAFMLAGRNVQKLDAVADDLRARGAAKVQTFQVDFDNVDRHEALLSAAYEALGGLDLALIAWGVLPNQADCEADVKTALGAWHTNATATIALLTPLANRFESQGSGTIAVIGSVAGDRGRRDNYLYGATKAGLDAFLQGLRARMYKAGVAVVTIKPGPIDTPMTAHREKSAAFAKPETAGRAVYKAIKRKRDVVYVPLYWRLIMAGLSALPEAVMKRLNLSA